MTRHWLDQVMTRLGKFLDDSDSKGSWLWLDKNDSGTSLLSWSQNLSARCSMVCSSGHLCVSGGSEKNANIYQCTLVFGMETKLCESYEAHELNLMLCMSCSLNKFLSCACLSRTSCWLVSMCSLTPWCKTDFEFF